MIITYRTMKMPSCLPYLNRGKDKKTPSFNKVKRRGCINVQILIHPR